MRAFDPLRLDRAMGDPASDDGPLGFRWAVRLDEREEFPAQAAAELDRLGVCKHYVPIHAGGELRSFEELACMQRAIARRDVTLAVAHGKTGLGTLPVFLAGVSTLKAIVAARVIAGEPIALALTERHNGSDLLSSVTRAEGSSVLSVNGEKWLINNATRATALSVFVRTRSEGGPGGSRCSSWTSAKPRALTRRCRKSGPTEFEEPTSAAFASRMRRALPSPSVERGPGSPSSSRRSQSRGRSSRTWRSAP